MQLQTIQNKIYEIRGYKIMLDFDLSDLYEVETKYLNLAVKRNRDRFPERFMFRLTIEEWAMMRSQFVTASNQSKRNVHVTPFAFTEHGVTMLASVLRSEKAIQINIAIVEAFIALREFALSHKDLSLKLRQLELQFNKKFDDVYSVLDHLLDKDDANKKQMDRKKIGY